MRMAKSLSKKNKELKIKIDQLQEDIVHDEESLHDNLVTLNGGIYVTHKDQNGKPVSVRSFKERKAFNQDLLKMSELISENFVKGAKTITWNQINIDLPIKARVLFKKHYDSFEIQANKKRISDMGIEKETILKIVKDIEDKIVIEKEELKKMEQGFSPGYIG